MSCPTPYARHWNNSDTTSTSNTNNIMKELLQPFTNWRIHILMLLGMAAAVLILSEHDDKTAILTCLLIKAAGLTLAYTTYLLGRYWNSRGKIQELMSIADDEEDQP